MQLYVNIKNKRKEWKMTQEELALLTGYTDRSSIAKIEKGLVDLTQSKIELFAKVLHTTPGELLGYEDANISSFTPSTSTKIPVYGCIPAGVPLEAIECIDGYVDIPDEWLKSGDTYFALKVKGSSMSPKYIDGDIIILKRQSDCESGQDAAVRVNGDEATLKKVIKQQFGIMLQPINPEYEPRMYEYNDENYPIEIMGIVVQLRRDV